MANNLLDKASIILTPTAYNNGEALCVKPSDGSGDFDFSRNSAATRVNAQGLVENVQILSSNLVQNGDFSEEGAEEVSNGSFSQEGAELVTNGDFSVSTGWQGLNADRVISNGKLNISQASGFGVVYQPETLTVGTYYKCVVEVSNYVDGSFQIGLAGSDAANTSPIINSDGTFTFYLQRVSGGSNNIGFVFNGLANLSIDNVSVREVGQDWVLTSGAAIGENKLDINANAYDYFARQLDVSTIGKTYKVSVDAEIDSGRMILYLADTNAFEVIDTSGSYTFYIVADGTQIRFRAFDTALIGSITNISVKEVGQNWTLGTGWEIGNSVATKSGPDLSYLTQSSLTSVVGKTYNVKASITNVTTGNVRIDNFTSGTTYTSDTEVDVIYTATTAGAFRFLGWSGFDGTITNISVLEITDDTNLPRINYENGCGSWLFEPQSTNLITYSEDFTNNWENTQIDVTLNSVSSPDGKTNGALFSDGLGNGFHRLRTQNITNAGNYVFSIYVKQGTTSRVALYDYSGGNGGIGFNLEDMSNFSVGGLSVTPIGNYGYGETLNGFTRIWLKTTYITNNPIAIFMLDNTETISYQGNNNTMFFYGGQLEQQSYATSYIPTSGSQVTRNQDVCTNGGSLATINSTEGVLYAEVAALANDGTVRAIYISNGTTSNRLWIEFDAAANRFEARYIANGTTSANFFHTVSDITDLNKIAFKWKENDFSLYVNGLEVGNDTSGSAISADTLNRIDFHNQASSSVQNFFGKTKCFAVWKEALSDSELQSLTTI